MKIDSLYSVLKLLILGVILNYISGCTNLLDTTSPSYIKAYTHTEDLYILKSATKPLKVLIAFTRPLITEFADNLNLKHPLLPTISPYPTM